MGVILCESLTTCLPWPLHKPAKFHDTETVNCTVGNIAKLAERNDTAMVRHLAGCASNSDWHELDNLMLGVKKIPNLHVAVRVQQQLTYCMHNRESNNSHTHATWFKWFRVT